MIDINTMLFAPEWGFLRFAVLVGLLISPALGVIGTLVVTRRISSLAGASAHAALGGFGLALFLQRACGLAFVTASGGALAYAALYLLKSYAYSGRLLKGLTHEAAMVAVVSKIPATIFNAAVAIIFAPILAVAICKALKRNHLSLN